MIIEKIVESDTKFTDTETDLLNFVANIVVEAATGAEAAIMVESRIVPLIPQRYKTARLMSGIAASRRAIAR